VLHHADIPKAERTWFGSIPVTSVRRTLRDCAAAALSPEMLRRASKQALQRGLVTRADLADVRASLKAFGGLSA
jgi:hypothetical protein